MSKDRQWWLDEEEEAAADGEKKMRVFVLCLVKIYDEVIVKVVDLLCG